MNERVREDICDILKRLIDIFTTRDEKDILEISELSNHTIHDASIFQDEDSIAIAVLIYALVKIISRKPEIISYEHLQEMSNSAYIFITNNNIEGYRHKIKEILRYITNIDAKIKFYIEDVINQAQIKKGSKIYAHGISLARAANILGISQWDLMRYIGKTSIVDRFIDEPKLTKSRLEFTRGLFQ